MGKGVGITSADRRLVEFVDGQQDVARGEEKVEFLRGDHGPNLVGNRCKQELQRLEGTSKRVERTK